MFGFDILQPLFSLGTLQIHVLDILIVGVLLLYAFEGYALGFVVATLDLLTFIASFIFGLTAYGAVGGWLVSWFGLSLGFSNALGFFIAAFVSEIALGFLLRYVLRFIIIPLPLRAINKVFGVIPGVLSSIILLAFLLTLAVSLPLSPYLKKTIASSHLATALVVQTQGFEKRLTDVFGGAVSDTLNFLTVEPASDSFVTLRFKTTEVSIDTRAEGYMLFLLNEERKKRGLKALTMDSSLQAVARAHGKDMFAKGYFSHYSPTGLSPFDRMAKANIAYTHAGENLALSPTTDLAMQGLMQSPGHKANILSPDFGKVGIGVIDGGIYGEMFVQEFRD